MAHFAKINETNEVLTVLYIEDKYVQNNDGVETESLGQAYLEANNNWPSNQWIQTSYNTFNNTHKLGGTPFRGNYANIGYIWDSENNIFIRPRPYSSWTKNLTTADWESPAGPQPSISVEDKEAGKYYQWNDTNLNWELITP